MVSIRESITEFEKIYELQTASLECYRSAVQAMANYPVDFDAGATESFKRDLTALSSDLRGQMDARGLLATRAALRDELRDYHDKAAMFLNGLREELSQKARALDLLADAMASADGDHEERLRESLSKLREVSESPAAAGIRNALLTISDQLAQSIEQMKQQVRLIVGQFRAEIKMLHGQIASLQTDFGQGTSAHLNGRVEMETRISEEMAAGRSFSLLILKIRNLMLIERQFGAQARSDVVTEFAARVLKILPQHAALGRWSVDQFVALAPVEKSEAVALVKRLTLQVGENPAGESGGGSRRVPAQVNAAVLVNSPSDTYESLLRKIENYL
jgi:GGDEF domain-containing protein